jgi:hypothetical protein
MGKLHQRGVNTEMNPTLLGMTPMNTKVQGPSTPEGKLQPHVQFMPGPFRETIQAPEFGVLRAQLLTVKGKAWDPKDNRTELQILTDFLQSAQKLYVRNSALGHAATCAKAVGSANTISEEDFNLLKKRVQKALENEPESANLQFASAMLNHIASRQPAIMR